MSKARADREDFRAAAVAESLRNLGAIGSTIGSEIGGNPLSAGVSYCLPVGGAEAAGVRRARAETIGALVGAVVLIAVACVLMIPVGPGSGSSGGGGGGAPTSGPRLATAIVCMVGSGVLMIGPTVLHRRRTRRIVSERFGGTPWDTDARPITVNIEDAATHGKLKVLPEDMGMMMLYEDPGCVQIEGVHYRYLIHAQDVLSVTAERPASTESVTIRYRVGEAQLGLTLFQTSLLSETRRQLVGRNALYRKVRRVLLEPGDGSGRATDPAAAGDAVGV